MGSDEGAGRDWRGAHSPSAMLPSASVSGLYFAGKNSQYFNVGKITADQVKEYADRKGQDFKVAEKWLSPILSYEP